MKHESEEGDEMSTIYDYYIECQAWQLSDVRALLKNGESVSTNDRCFRANTYCIRSTEARWKELQPQLADIGIKISMQ